MSIRGAQCCVDAAGLVLDRLHGDAECHGDLFERPPGRQCRDDLDLSSGQLRRIGGGEPAAVATREPGCDQRIEDQARLRRREVERHVEQLGRRRVRQDRNDAAPGTVVERLGIDVVDEHDFRGAGRYLAATAGANHPAERRIGTIEPELGDASSDEIVHQLIGDLYVDTDGASERSLTHSPNGPFVSNPWPRFMEAL